MSEQCDICPGVIARLAIVGGGLRVLAAFINAELDDEPTMPWKELLPLIAVRVELLADQAQGA